MNPIRHIICCSEVERVPALVLRYTILKHASRDCDVRLSYEIGAFNPPTMTGPNRPRTNFSYHRFCAPKLLGYEGRVIVTDSDMLVFADEAEIFDAPMEFGELYDRGGRTPHPNDNINVLSACPFGKPHQNGSVMVVDCAKVKWDVDDISARISKGTLDYGRLMRLEDIGVRWAPVDHNWNCLDVRTPQTKLCHFTDMGRQPWKHGRSAHPHSDLWFKALAEAMDAGVIGLLDLDKAVSARHLHPDVLGVKVGQPQSAR